MNQHLFQRRGAWTRRLCASGAVIALLAGCAETQLGAQVAKSVVRSNAGDGQKTAPEPVDVAADPALAPEAFDATGLTIWDGGATLQGVWFAHPLAQRAQRARVFNTENGLVVEGALFRRDPAISGPSILLSSDAARDLGVTPGKPTELRIIALREGPAATQTASAAPATGSGTEPVAENAPIETAALPAVGDEVEPAATGGEAAADAELEALETPPEIETEVETTNADPVPEPSAEPTAGAPETEIAAAEQTAEPAAEIAAETAAETGEAPAPGDGATAAPQAEPKIELAETKVAATSDPTPEPTPEPTPAPRPKPASQTAASDGAVKPTTGALPPGSYLQIGSFSIEFNAKTLVERLRSRGQPAKYVNRKGASDTFSVVVIGPLADANAVDDARAASAAEGQPKPLEVKL